MTKINVGVLGCGFWGKNHARVLSEIETCNLLAVSDVDEEKARTVGKKYHTKWYADPSKLIERKDAEFISLYANNYACEASFRNNQRRKNGTFRRRRLKTLKTCEAPGNID